MIVPKPQEPMNGIIWPFNEHFIQGFLYSAELKDQAQKGTSEISEIQWEIRSLIMQGFKDKIMTLTIDCIKIKVDFGLWQDTRDRLLDLNTITYLLYPSIYHKNNFRMDLFMLARLIYSNQP